MNHIKKFSHINETNEEYIIQLSDSDIYTDDKRYLDIFDLNNMNTIINIDVTWYIEKSMVFIAELCTEYHIIPNKKVIDNIVYDIKYYVEESILYRDDDDIDYDSILNFNVQFLKYLEVEQPEEYNKYNRIKKSKEFNL